MAEKELDDPGQVHAGSEKVVDEVADTGEQEELVPPAVDEKASKAFEAGLVSDSQLDATRLYLTRLAPPSSSPRTRRFIMRAWRRRATRLRDAG